jgi:alkylhydroperoxidase family enzyme
VGVSASPAPCDCAISTPLPRPSPPCAGVPRPVIDTLTAWWETDFHDDAARAALAYTEAITRVADATVADDFGSRHLALAEHFSQEEILEIIGIAININVWTRLKLAEGATPGLAEQTMS